MAKSKTGRKPKIAILTSLVDFSPGYSLSGVILDQARAFRRAGYEYDLLCIKNFNRGDPKTKEVEAEGLSVKYILPQTRLVDYGMFEKPRPDKRGEQGFETQVRVHFEGDNAKGWVGYRDALRPYDVVISHDIMFLSWHLPQNKALRACIDLWPEKNWLHQVHSGPSHAKEGICYPSELRYTRAPHSHYIYLNHTQAQDYSLMIRSEMKYVRTVYNPKDIRDVWNFSELSRDIIDKYDLLDHQVLQVYPFSTPRWRDKGVPQLLRIFGHWKKAGIKVKLVLITAHCNNDIDIPHIGAMGNLAQAEGLELDRDVVISYRYAKQQEDPKVEKELRYSVPFSAVRELVCISNMFIFPTVSECCSLIQAEASMAGKFMVLNRDFIPLLEFCVEGVMSYEFTKNKPDVNPTFYECVAKEIWANFQADTMAQNRTRAITKTYNADWVFKNQLEPLLYLGSTKEQVKAGPPEKEVLRPEFSAVEEPHGEGEGAVILEGPNGQEVPMKLVKVDGGTSSASVTPPKIEIQVEEQEGDYTNPTNGMPCPIYGRCSEELRGRCFDEAGQCLVLGE